MKQELRDKLFQIGMRGLLGETEQDRKELEEMTAEDIVAMEPVLDSAIRDAKLEEAEYIHRNFCNCDVKRGYFCWLSKRIEILRRWS